MKSLWKLCKIAWASPYSLLGILIGIAGMLTGGKARFRSGAVEFYGGSTRWCVCRLPTGKSTMGITLGHVILGQDAAGLARAEQHERVHVRQFELWGPFMGPAYLLASLWVWCRGGNAYYDNPFELEAYREAP